MKKQLTPSGLLLFFLLSIILNSCNDDDGGVNTAFSISPSVGFPELTVTITGMGFSPVPEENLVTFNGEEATVLTASSTELTVGLPSSGTTGSVIVTVNGVALANAPIFTYFLQPKSTLIEDCSEANNADDPLEFDFKIGEIVLRTNHDPDSTQYYQFNFTIDITNTSSSESVNLGGVAGGIQSYLSIMDDIMGNDDDIAASGWSGPEGMLQPGETLSVSRSSSSIGLDDPLTDDGYYIFTEIIFEIDGERCAIVFSTEINII